MKYLPLLKRFAGIISPDYSIHREMPLALQIWNTYRNRALSYWMQANGIKIVPNVRWGDERTYSFAFEGIPVHSSVAISTNGCIQDKLDRYYFRKGLEEIDRRRIYMTTENLNQIRETLSTLIGQPLHKITRAADTICLHLGGLIEKRCAVRGEDGRFTVSSAMVGEYALHVSSCFRLSCGKTIVAAKSDLYQPSAAARAEFGEELPEEYDYDTIGNNRLDEIIFSSLSDLDGCIVQKIIVRRFGDLRIVFSNGFEMELIVDLSGGEECWRFFRHGDADHLVITGQGLAVDAMEDSD